MRVVVTAAYAQVVDYNIPMARSAQEDNSVVDLKVLGYIT